MKWKKLLIILIGIIVFIVVLLFVYSIIYKSKSLNPNNDDYSTNTINESNQNSIDDFDSSFKNIFDNKFKNKDYINQNINKIQEVEPFVYTIYKKKEVIEGKYDVDVNIPFINIDSEISKKYNQYTQEIFVNKLNSILSQENYYTIYTINYVAYINEDILSLVIKATVKEGTNSQRVIVQSYNLNLLTLQEVTFSNLMEQKMIDESLVTNRISKVLTEKNLSNVALKEAGYDVYIRDLDSSYYNIENIDNYFISSDGSINVIYAYGNENYTSEIDVIKIVVD